MTKNRETPASVRRRLLGTSIVALVVGLSAPAFAQDAATTAGPAQDASSAKAAAKGQDNHDAEIVVTGSRIRRTGYDTLQPTTVLGAATINERAVSSVADALRELPAFGAPGSTSIGEQGRASIGQAFVNYFSLGSQRTLTLINGVRFPSASTPSANGPGPGLQVDLNTIPVALIDRVETIAVGGSPIYGSDAIAGTVNVILKKKFTGFDATVSGGLSSRGDAGKYRIQALYGVDFAGGKGNIVFNGEYNHQSPLAEKDRKLTAEQSTFQAPLDPDSPFQNVIVRNSRYPFVNTVGIPLSTKDYAYYGGEARDADGNMLQFSPSGNLVTYDPGQETGGGVTSGGDGINLANYLTLLTQSDRYLGNVFVNYEFQPSLKLHLEGWYSRNDTVEPYRQPVYNSFFATTDGETDAHYANGPYSIRLDNPYLTQQARGILSKATDFNGDGVPDNVLDLNGDGVPDTQGFYLDKADADLTGTRPAHSRQQLYRFLGTLDGNFIVADRKFEWSLTGAYGATVSTYRQSTTLVNQLNQAVDTVVDPITGKIVCRDQSNGCVPLNPFTGSPDPAAVAFVTADTTSKTKTSQALVSANLNGDLFKVPAGHVSIALGADWRREHSSFTPDPLAASGQVRNAPATAVSGGFDTKEVYAETLIPVINRDMEIPLISKLEFEGAARYVDNSRSGGAVTWTAGGRYAPVRGIEFRGNFTHSIRSPAVTELFLPDAPIASFANDPCDTRYIHQGNDPARRAANCAASGIGQPFRSSIVDESHLISVKGNPNLKNEQAKAWTAGAVIAPSFLPGFVASADWVDIRLKDAIEQLDATTTLDACYDSADFPNAPVCHNFTRTAAGQIATLNTGYVNAGSLRFSGLTANLAYNFSIGQYGRLALSANYQFTNKLDTSITGSDLHRQAGEIGYSKHKATGSITWTKDKLNLFWEGVFVGKAKFDNSDAPGSREVSGVGNWAVFNAAVSYDIEKRLQLQLSMDNVFDRGAPRNAAVDDNSSAISTYFSGFMGRTYTVSARMHF